MVYPVMSLEAWDEYDVDKIIITPAKYQEEIRHSLIKRGFKKEQIGTVDELVFLLFDHSDLIGTCIFGNGLELGGPSAIFSYIYKMCKNCDGVNFRRDTVWWKEDDSEQYICEERKMGKMYITDATDLTGIQDELYDFVCSSNTLEHIANPMKALSEFYRVVKKDGIVIIVVPRKFVNFDHNRPFTSFAHILADYKNNVTEDDLSHLPEIIEKHDYDMDIACGGKEKFIRRASENFENRCLHHHVFDKSCLMELFDCFNLEILEFAETYNDYWMIGRK